ncbi:MAG: hypothetical protein IPP29_08100 [Bacteroidetes bacterium]|nr:hypothetical protein [Bacteroidota bacterium]
MTFYGTQATISDSAGNFLMSSNGIFIADATNDTMDNGDSLNPGTVVNQWSDGLLYPNANLFLPWPGDTINIFYCIIH